MFKLQKVRFFDFVKQIYIISILYRCGKDMANKYDLHHWDNSYLKIAIIIFLCELKNTLYILINNHNVVATFQVKKIEKDVLYFEKLAVLPDESRNGVGSYCMNCIEEIAKKENCNKVIMEVYASSQHALDFYKKRGYVVSGEDKSLKYSLVKMEKKIK